MSRPADLIVGGWVINGFYTFQSGQPITVTCPNRHDGRLWLRRQRLPGRDSTPARTTTRNG